MKSLLPYALLALTLAGCDFYVYGSERAGCVGFPRFLRTLPDTTVVLDSAPLIIPLEEGPPLAYHTGGMGFSYQANTGDYRVARSHIALIKNKRTLSITLVDSGETNIWVLIRDECDVEVSTHFRLVVL